MFRFFNVSFILFFVLRLFHPVKRMKVGNNPSNGDRPSDSSDGGSSFSGKQMNGNLMVSVRVIRFSLNGNF